MHVDFSVNFIALLTSPAKSHVQNEMDFSFRILDFLCGFWPSRKLQFHKPISKLPVGLVTPDSAVSINMKCTTQYISYIPVIFVMCGSSLQSGLKNDRIKKVDALEVAGTNLLNLRNLKSVDLP